MRWRSRGRGRPASSASGGAGLVGGRASHRRDRTALGPLTRLRAKGSSPDAVRSPRLPGDEVWTRGVAVRANRVARRDRARRTVLLGGVATAALALAVSGTSFALAATSTGTRAATSPTSWVRAPAPAGTRHVALHGVSCAGTSCLAIGQFCASNACTGVTPQVTLATRNLGATWTRSGVPANLQITFAGVACATPAFCAVGGTANAGSPSPTAALSITRNLGASWSTRPVGGLGILIASTCATTSLCYATGMANPPVSQTAFGQVAVTRNGGAKWTVETFPLTSYVDGITCATPSRCTAFATSDDGGNTVLLRTTNAGASWATRSLPRSASGCSAGSSAPPRTSARASAPDRSAPRRPSRPRGMPGWRQGRSEPSTRRTSCSTRACETARRAPSSARPSTRRSPRSPRPRGGPGGRRDPWRRRWPAVVELVRAPLTRASRSAQCVANAPSDGGPLLLHRYDGPSRGGSHCVVRHEPVLDGNVPPNVGTPRGEVLVAHGPRRRRLARRRRRRARGDTALDVVARRRAIATARRSAGGRGSRRGGSPASQRSRPRRRTRRRAG